VSGTDFSEKELGNILIGIIDKGAELQNKKKEELEELRKEWKDKVGVEIKIENPNSKEGDGYNNIALENLKYKLIVSSIVTKGAVINKKLNDLKVRIDADPDDYCIGLDVKLDLCTDKGGFKEESRIDSFTFNKDYCHDSKEKFSKIIEVIGKESDNWQGLNTFKKSVNCDGIENYKTAYTQCGSGKMEVEEIVLEENGKKFVTFVTIPTTTYVWQNVEEREDIKGNKIYSYGVDFDTAYLVGQLRNMAGDVLKKKGVKGLNNVEYKIGTKDNKNRLCPKLTLDNIRNLETNSTNGFCSEKGVENKNECIKELINSISGDKGINPSIGTWFGCSDSSGWTEPK
jgi:hypothetical protein